MRVSDAAAALAETESELSPAISRSRFRDNANAHVSDCGAVD
jgi:hypothetical protein